MLEKRNVIEPGRTPADPTIAGSKIADADQLLDDHPVVRAAREAANSIRKNGINRQGVATDVQPARK